MENKGDLIYEVGILGGFKPMENKGDLIYEVGILGGNDKVKTNLFVLFVLISSTFFDKLFKDWIHIFNKL